LGRRAEDGTIPDEYMEFLEECDSRDYRVRTRLNVQNSDTTVLIYRPPIRGGTLFTQQRCLEYDVPFLPLPIDFGSGPKLLRLWINAVFLRSKRKRVTINFAGPRESNHPGIQEETAELVWECLEAIHGGEP
jgi:hypothetical protein